METKTGSGQWFQEEKLYVHHIHILEMGAAHLAVEHFSQNLSNKVVLLASDNTSVVWYLKKQGGPNRGTCSWRPSTYSAQSWN